MKNLNELKYKVQKVKIKNTGYPMDEHEAIVLLYEHQPEDYILLTWKIEDDLIFAESMYRAETDYGMCATDDFQEFLKIWNSGDWEPLAQYCLTPEEVELIDELGQNS